MKRIYSIVFVCALFGISAAAQNRQRVFDNFDTTHGVQINAPTVAPLAQPKAKQLIKKTAQTKMSVEEGAAFKDAKKTDYSAKFSMAAGSSLKGFTTGDVVIDSYIVDSSKRYNIDPLLIYAQMHQESAFKLKATSHKGASGLMQLMPATARRFGVTQIYNPRQNIEAGVKYMRWLLDTFNQDVVLALAGYNAGEGAVMRFGRRVPPYRETQEYVRRITGRYNSISNPMMLAKTVRKVSSEQEAVKLEEKAAAPLEFEADAMTIRLPDGRMRLVNQ